MLLSCGTEPVHCLATIVTSLSSTVLIIQIVTSDPSVRKAHISWLYLTSMLLPLVLDLSLAGILLHYLTRTMKRVYAPHTRKRISRLANVVWQTALPPTLCTICLCVIYVQFKAAHREDLRYWPKVIQAMIGKLYVLSLFYMINAQALGGPPQPDERPSPFASTLTVPAGVLCTLTLDARVGDLVCSDISPGHSPAWTVELAV